MSYKALYDILCSVKRHMNARVIFRWKITRAFAKFAYMKEMKKTWKRLTKH